MLLEEGESVRSQGCSRVHGGNMPEGRRAGLGIRPLVHCPLIEGHCRMRRRSPVSGRPWTGLPGQTSGRSSPGDFPRPPGDCSRFRLRTGIGVGWSARIRRARSEWQGEHPAVPGSGCEWRCPSSCHSVRLRINHRCASVMSVPFLFPNQGTIARISACNRAFPTHGRAPGEPRVGVALGLPQAGEHGPSAGDGYHEAFGSAGIGLGQIHRSRSGPSAGPA